MRNILTVGVFCLLILVSAVPAAASGFLDEMVLSSEWWARENQQGEIEVFALGTYGSDSLGTSCHFSLRQETNQDSVFAVNGSFGLEQMLVLNTTAKFGTPDLYYGVGGVFLTAEQEKILFLPRLNGGGKFGPEMFKLVLDADFYSLILVNGGKLEIGVELIPLENLRLYGGMLKLFTGTLITSELVPGTIYQITAEYETKPFYVGGEIYFVDEVGPVFLGEAGVNYSFISLYGRMGVPSQAAGEFGAYTIGVRVNY